MLTVYDKKVKSVQHTANNGLAKLCDATDVCVTQEVNGQRSLEFNLPPVSENWKFIQNENIVKADDQLYRIRCPSDKRSDSGVLNCTVKCDHVFYDAGVCKHIPKLEEIGQAPYDILKRAFSGTHFNVIKPPGMTWITKKTDIEQDKMTPLSVLNELIKLVEGEIYIDNWDIALVERVGKDLPVRFSAGSNMKGVERTVDTSDLCTRLYPYGKSSLEIDDINGGRDYLDSEYIDNYAFPYIRHMDFSDIETKEELLAEAKKQFEGEKRIDVPKITYSCTVADLFKIKDYGDFEKYSLGDTVTIYDKDLNIEAKQRIVGIKNYPYEPKMSTVTLGTPPKTLSGVLGELQKTTDTVKNITQPGGVKSEWFNSIIEVVQQQVASYNKKIDTYDHGLCFEDENGALLLIGGSFFIANKRKPDGTWDYRTAGSGNGLIAEHAAFKEINTNLIKVMSNDGDFQIYKDAMRIRRDGFEMLITPEGMKVSHNGQDDYTIYDAYGVRRYYAGEQIPLVWQHANGAVVVGEAGFGSTWRSSYGIARLEGRAWQEIARKYEQASEYQKSKMLFPEIVPIRPLDSSATFWTASLAGRITIAEANKTLIPKGVKSDGEVTEYETARFDGAYILISGSAGFNVVRGQILEWQNCDLQVSYRVTATPDVEVDSDAWWLKYNDNYFNQEREG